MPASSVYVLGMSERYLAWRQPGRSLTFLARRSLPLLASNWLAGRMPEAGTISSADISPLVIEVDPAPLIDDGVLAGEPVVVKDGIDVAGHRTGIGMIDGGELATEDATVVARVRAGGGWIFGKTKMTELGIDGIGALMHTPMPRNPRAPGYFAGGSSTGTAVAVASGLARYGIGTDGLGSVRIPAAFCGLVGLKPSHGALPSEGCRTPASSLDTSGPMARNVADCARLWQIMAGEQVAALEPLRPERVGLVRQLGPRLASRAVQAAFHRALAAIGARTETVDIEAADCCTFLGGMIGSCELVHSEYASREMSPAGRMNLALGRSFAARDIARLDHQRGALRKATASALAQTPILAFPTTAIPAPALSHGLLEGGQDLLVVRALGAYTPLANLTGLPAIAVPSGVDDRGRPLSIMFMTVAAETTLLRIALAVERMGVATTPA